MIGIETQEFNKLQKNCSFKITRIGQEFCSPQKKPEKSKRAYYSLHFVLFGSGTLRDGDNIYKVKAKSAFLLYGDREYEYYPDPKNPWTYIWVDLWGDNLDEMFQKVGFDRNSSVIKINKMNEFNPILRDMYDAFSYNIHGEMAYYGYFFLIFDRLIDNSHICSGVSKAKILNKKLIRNILIYMNNNYWYLKHDPSNTEVIALIDHDINEYSTKQIPLFVKRKLTKDEIDEKVNKAAAILNLDQLLTRKPAQLSGGQCQRVALGRVIVNDSKLLLMDEPLSNLDAKLRVSMRSEIINLHRTLNATTVYVTHDQVEAMTMADRIVIMDRAHIKQIGTPAEVYDEPNSLFVAEFIGSPAMNIFEVEAVNDAICLDGVSIKRYNGLKEKLNKFYNDMLDQAKERLEKLPELFTGELLADEERLVGERIAKIEAAINTEHYPLRFGVRPDGITLSEAQGALVGTIVFYELLGDQYHITMSVGKEKLVLKLPASFKFALGDEIRVDFSGHCYLFDSVSGNRII